MGNFITGESGSFTFVNAETLVVADFGVWQGSFTRNVFRTTPFAYRTQRMTLGRLNTRGEILQWVDGVVPPIPENGSIAGQMVLQVNSTLTYSFNARLFYLNMTSNSATGEPVAPQYRFVSTSASTPIRVIPGELQFNDPQNSMLVPLM